MPAIEVRRPYVGRYVPPETTTPALPRSREERFAALMAAAKAARWNAWYARRKGDEKSASAAFYRAHDYVEFARQVRDEI